MINRLLVANRAEIASRVFRTCRRLGIETVAIHSDADAGLPYVAEADTAVRLPGNTPGETYLRADLAIEAARKAGADAIHPGYGFLSENADFAQAVVDAGLTWVGPDPSSITSMGSKIGAKELMKSAGVPILEAPESPTEADLPLLVKASAGGGGRGMRIVRALADLETEIRRAREEAASAFGDGTVFVEPYVERGRHVEVQVVGDGAGDVLVLPLSSYRQPDWNDGHKVLDPLGRVLLPVPVASDELVVDDVVIEGEDQRVQRVRDAIELPTPQARADVLGSLGVGAVATDLTAPGPAPDVAGETLLDDGRLRVVRLDEVDETTSPTSWQVAMGLAWTAHLAVLLAAVVAGVRCARQRLRRNLSG